VSLPVTESEVLLACQILFGSDVNVCRDLLLDLRPEKARSAYRKKAKEVHPDFYALASPNVQKRQSLLFQAVLRAYEIVDLFIKTRENRSWNPSSHDQTPNARDQHHCQNEKAYKPCDESSASGDFCRRPLPGRVLELGRYLYYSGRISYKALIDALVWQRKQRPLIGHIAMRWGWLNAAAIDQITRLTKHPGRFGERAVQAGLLTSFQVNTLVYFQRTQQERLGRYFVQKNILDCMELERLVQELHKHNAAVRSDIVHTNPVRSSHA